MNEQVSSLYAEISVKITAALRGLREFRSRLRASQGALKTLRDQSKITGAALNLGLTAGLSALGAKAVSAFGDAEKAMNVFKLATGATSDEMTRASAAIEAVAHDLSLPGITRADAANALLALGQGGLKAVDAINALRPALLLAEAGEMKGAEAATILSDALTTFKLPGTEAARIADLLAAAALKAAGSVRDHADAVAAAGPTWAAAHIPIEDLVTVIAELANAGQRGQDAGTRLKAMLLALQNPTEEARALMQAMGVHVYDASGKMKDFRTIIGEFQRGLEPLTQAQKDQRLATIFGSDAVTAAVVIFGEGTAGFDKMKAAVTQSGAAQELATAKTAGLSGATDGLAKAIDTATTDAVKPFEEDIKALAAAMTTAVLWFDGLDDSTKKAIVSVGGILLVLGPLGLAFQGVGGAIGGVVTAGGFLLGSIDALGVAATFLAVSPLGLAILAIGGLAAVLVWAYNENETFRGAVDATFRTIDGWVRPVTDGIRQLEAAFHSWSGIRVDFGAIIQGIPILREVLAAWEQLRRWGVGGSGGAVGGSFAPNPPVTVGAPTPGGAVGFVNGQPVPAMAGGGPVRGGEPYWVGERGPELFTPGRSGGVTPNGAGGATVNNNFYGPVFGFSDLKDHIARAVAELKAEGRV